jgi:hypothetical protein
MAVPHSAVHRLVCVVVMTFHAFGGEVASGTVRVMVMRAMRQAAIAIATVCRGGEAAREKRQWCRKQRDNHKNSANALH